MSDAPPGHKLLDWMPWRPTRFWGSIPVLRLSEAACNLYRWMLDYQWIHGSVPDDAVVVSRIYPWGQSALDSWREVRPLFEARDGVLVNVEVEATHAEQAGIVAAGRTQRSEAGRASAAARAEKYGSSAPAVNGRSTVVQTAVRTDTLNGRTTERNGTERNGSEQNRTEPQKRAARVASKPPAVVEKKPRAELTGDAADFRRWWCEEFLAVTGRPYAWNFGLDGKRASGLLAVGLDEVKRRAWVLLHAPPAWMVDQGGGIDLGTLERHFNKLASAGKVSGATGAQQAVLNAVDGASPRELFLPPARPRPQTRIA